jgi:hypothetical protein
MGKDVNVEWRRLDVGSSHGGCEGKGVFARTQSPWNHVRNLYWFTAVGTAFAILVFAHIASVPDRQEPPDYPLWLEVNRSAEHIAELEKRCATPKELAEAYRQYHEAVKAWMLWNRQVRDSLKPCKTGMSQNPDGRQKATPALPAPRRSVHAQEHGELPGLCRLWPSSLKMA